MDFQNVEINYGALDTHTDPAEMPIGALTVAENVSSQVDGRYSKRFGYETLEDSGTSSCVRLAKRGSELLLLDQTSLRSFEPNTGEWPVEVPTPCTSSEQTYIAIEQSRNFVNCTRATVGGLTVHSWIDQSSGVLYTRMYNEDDNSIVATSSNGSFVWNILHSVVVGTKVAIFYSSSASQQIGYTIADTSNLSFASSTFKSGVDVFAGTVGYPYAPFDICAVSSTEVLVFWANDTPQMRIARFNITNGTSSYNAVIAAEEPDGGIAVFGVDGEFATAMWHSASSGTLRVRGFTPSNGVALYAVSTVDAAAGNYNCGITRASSTSHVLIWDTRLAAPLKGTVNWRTVSNSGSFGAMDTVNNVYLQSKPYTYGGKYYANVFAPYNTQETYFTVEFNTQFTSTVWPVAVHAARTAYASGNQIACLTEVEVTETGVYRFDSAIAYKFITSGNAAAGIATFTTDHISAHRFQTSELGGSAQFAASIPFRYDGLRVIESNFLLYPEITSAVAGAVGASGMDNGTRSYIVVFEAADRTGNADRSTTSLPVSVTTTAGAGLGKATLTIDHLTITSRIYDAQVISATIFRTENGGTTYYFLTSRIVDPLGSNFTYVDQAQDSTLLTHRIIYTQGGIVDREPAPSAKQLIVHQNRVWGISSVDPKMLFYSGDYVPGEAPWFSTLQQFRIEPGGDITAISSLDEQLIVFKEDRIFRVLGRGLSATGINSDLTPPAEITSDCGCIEPRSLVTTPMGVMFQSAKGIYLLSRGGELSNVGLSVDSFLEDFPSVTAAVMMPAVQEVRFDLTNVANDEGMKLVYNYRDNRWTTHTNFDPFDPANSDARIDALIKSGVYHCADPAGNVYRETTGYRDPADASGNPPQYIASRLATGWMKLAGKQGLIRVQRINILNEIREEHDLEFQIKKDYIDVSVQTANFTAADIAALPQEQYSLHVQNQQGESFMFEMIDSESDVAESEGYWARGLSLVAGVKRGSFEKTMQSGAKA